MRSSQCFLCIQERPRRYHVHILLGRMEFAARAALSQGVVMRQVCLISSPHCPEFLPSTRHACFQIWHPEHSMKQHRPSPCMTEATIFGMLLPQLYLICKQVYLFHYLPYASQTMNAISCTVPWSGAYLHRCLPAKAVRAEASTACLPCVKTLCACMSSAIHSHGCLHVEY